MAQIPYRCFIIADKNGDAWDIATEIHRNLENRLGDVFHLNELTIEKFRNGEIKPRTEKNLRNSHCFYIADSNQDPQYWLTQLAFVNHTLKNSSADKIVNVLPNLFFSRQDRKDEPRVPISSKVVADIIGLYADRVLTIDVHSQQIQGFYDIPFDSLPSFRTVADYLHKNHREILEDEELAFGSPDAGGGKRAEGFAKRFGKQNVAIGYKIRVRDGDVEKIRFPKEQIEGRNIFLVDDIGDSFGTINEACDELKDNGAKKIYVYCTHAFFTKGYGILDKLDKLFIGNTVKQPYIMDMKIPDASKGKLEEISFAPMLSEAIYRTSMGESLSALFK